MSVKTVTQYLGLNVRDGGSPQLKRIRGVGAVANVGPAFGALDSGGSVNDQPINRAVFFNGGIYSAVGDGIYQSLTGGLSWSLVLTIPSINASTAFKSGLNVVVSVGTIYLCLMYFDTSSDLRAVKSTDGVNWSSDGPFTVGSAGSLHNDTVWRNQLVALSANNSAAASRACFYSPGGGSFYALSPISSSESFCRSALGVFNDQLYTVGYDNSSGDRILYRLDGGNWVNIAFLGAFGGLSAADYKPAFLTDSNNLYLFSLKAPGVTWGCWQISSSETVTDITTSVIPASMTPSNTSRALTFVDSDWAPGTNPPKYLIYAADGTSGTGMSLYAWQGPSSPLFLLDTGGNVAQAFSVSKFPTASGFFIVGAPVCVIQMITPSTTEEGLVVSFLIQGPTTAYSLRVRLWYGLNDDPYLTHIGTLSNPSFGSLNATNTAVTGLFADNVTSYSFTWLPPSTITGTNGVGNRYKFGLEALI